MRTCGAALAGRKSFWVVAHNESTDHYICGPERPSCDCAVEDVRFMCDWVGSRVFGRLTRHDSVTFHIYQWAPDDPEGHDRFVWSWLWDESGAAGASEV
jgi:hypothetical protein